MSETRRFTGGRVFTGTRFVESLLVEDGRVAAAGSEPEVRRASPSGCEVERVSGCLLLPGLVDAHLHLAELTRAKEGLDLALVGSREEMVERVRRWAETHPSGPIIGRGWDVERFTDGADPTRLDLEQVVADRPVVLYHASGHTAVVNGSALTAVGYEDHTPDPPGGQLGRAPDGRPNGLLYERALEPVARFSSGAFPPEPEAMGRTLRYLASLGLTTIATLNTDPEELEALEYLERTDRLAVRVRAYLRFSRLAEVDLPRPFDGAEGRHLAVRGVKAFTDGAFGPRTAWLSSPYTDRPERSGGPTHSREELAAIVHQTVAAGLVPALHAIGDRALGQALMALDGSLPAPGPSRVEHASLVPPELFPSLDRVRPALVVQPGFVWSDGWLEARLGPARARQAYPFRTLMERGHLVVGSSDAPYDPVDPWRGLAASVERTGPDGRSANPDPGQALRPEEAIRLYTTNAGLGLGDPDLGHLEPGARADLVILDAPDLLHAISLGSAAVRETWCGGQRVWRRPTAAGPQ
jgi:predicted amidohydrolase YtcJ